MGLKLFYFTETYPFGLGLPWKTNELKVLAEKFEKVYIIPLYKSEGAEALSLPMTNVIVLDPCFTRPASQMSKPSYNIKTLRKAVGQFILNGKIYRRSKFLKALHFRRGASRLLKSASMQFALSATDDQTVWYFFWARGWADSLPFLGDFLKYKIAVRLHGFDLYKERNDGYIPFRGRLFDKADVLIPVSDHGKKYMEEVYNVPSKKIRVSRLGTHQFALARKSSDGILRILTCSDVVPVKRIDRMISSLTLINSIPIRWTHIGEGYLQNRILELSRGLPSNIVFDFKGGITPREVSDYYAENEIDVLINTSESEGIPVSVMEALSAGVPVIATNVGGTSEIVDEKVGRLLPGDFRDSELKAAIEEFYQLPAEQKGRLQDACLQRFMERCNAHSQARELCSILIQ